MQHIRRHNYMIKLIKIIIKYIKWAYTIDRHNLNVGEYHYYKSGEDNIIIHTLINSA